MSWFTRITDRWRRAREPLSTWFQVRFDENEISVSAQPPGRDPWQQSFRWEELVRICFQGEGGQASDGIYFFTSTRPESYVVPTEASGGDALVNELIRRGYFQSNEFGDAVLKSCGSLVWERQSAP